MRVVRIAAVLLLAGSAYGQQWGDWEKYRAGIVHPALTIKAADLVRARENVKRYPWAKEYVAKLEAASREDLARLTPQFVEQMIPETTPGSRIFTPCPGAGTRGSRTCRRGSGCGTTSIPKN